jgi:hypothetical protein
MESSDGLVSWASRNPRRLSISRNGGIMETDTLNTLVTGAIWRAEQLEARGIRTASQAWTEVSSLEEELAKAHPVSESQGRIARRGAVRAALKAGDYARADALADGYLAEEGAPESLRASLRAGLESKQ